MRKVAPLFESKCEHGAPAGVMCKKCDDKIPMHEIYPRIGTSDRQRAYLVKHGIKHVRKDGEYR